MPCCVFDTFLVRQLTRSRHLPFRDSVGEICSREQIFFTTLLGQTFESVCTRFIRFFRKGKIRSPSPRNILWVLKSMLVSSNAGLPLILSILSHLQGKKRLNDCFPGVVVLPSLLQMFFLYETFSQVHGNCGVVVLGETEMTFSFIAEK